MYNLEEDIDKIVRTENEEDMECLKEILIDTLEELEEYDETLTEKMKKKIYVMANGKVLTKEMAEEIIMNMQPYHMHWSFNETEAVRKQFGLDDIRDVDFWITMNSKYNDSKDTVEHFFPSDENKQLEMYVWLTKDFLKDPDAKEGKPFTYFTVVPK